MSKTLKNIISENPRSEIRGKNNKTNNGNVIYFGNVNGDVILLDTQYGTISFNYIGDL